MTIRRPQIPTAARRPRRALALAAALAGAALALALVATAAGGPRSAHAKCPLKDGTLDIFSTTDVSAVAGDIGPAQIRWIKLAEPDLNKGGGILGCKVKFTIQDEPLPNFQSGLRKYRAAIAS